MIDELQEMVRAIDRERELEPGFRAHLERMLSARTPSVDVGDVDDLWNIDDPREIPAQARARIERTLVDRPAKARRGRRTSVAAAILALLVVNSLVIASDYSMRARSNEAAAGDHLPDIERPAGSLQGFRSATEFLEYTERQAVRLVDLGLLDTYDYSDRYAPKIRSRGGPMSAELGSSRGGEISRVTRHYSTTNVQEEGVDEPDIVETNGRMLTILRDRTVYFLTVRAGRAKLESSLAVSDGGKGMFLHGSRLIVISESHNMSDAAFARTRIGRPWTKVTIVDIGDVARPTVTSSLSVEGSYVGARTAKGSLRLIVRSDSLGPDPVKVRLNTVEAVEEAVDAYKDAIRSSQVGDWIPEFVLRRRGHTPVAAKLHGWTSVRRPPDDAGIGLLTVMTVDPLDPRPGNATSVIGAGEIVYATEESLYVTSSLVDQRMLGGGSSNGTMTRVHKFELRHTAKPTYVGSGGIPGSVLNQFSLSEQDGILRVASTLDGGSSYSLVSTLAERGGKLVTIGRLSDLGRGERIQSVRFIGTMGYVVTFRQTDPLYAIDLRSPSSPKLLGELKVPGFSAYLHPLTDEVLLGIGQDATLEGVFTGLLLSLFDVSDPVNPRLIDKRTYGQFGGSPVTRDHHAFLYWEPERLAVVPASVTNAYGETFVLAIAIVAAPTGFGKEVFISHPLQTGTDGEFGIQRSIIIDESLVTISDGGVLVTDLKTMKDRSWVPLAA